MARVNPIGFLNHAVEFLQQVRAETAKVVWASGKQTWSTALMVMIMTSILGLFFLGVDRVLGMVVHFLLSLAGS